MNVRGTTPPGDELVDSPVARASGSKGETAKDHHRQQRTMNSMPSVATKLGMAKVEVINPLANPIAAAGRRPSESPQRPAAGNDQEQPASA